MAGKKLYFANVAAAELLRVAKMLTAASLLDGLTPAQARRLANKIISNAGKGLYSDESWKGVNEVWDAMTRAKIDWTMTGSKYDSEDGVPVRKTWTFTVNYMDKRGKQKELYGIVVASGAGSVDDPLSRYDVTAYVS